MKKKIIYIGLGILLGVLLLLGYLYVFNNLNQESIITSNYDFTIVAENYDTTGVDLTSGFLITSKEDYALDNVKETIKVFPEFEYNLTKSGSGSYYLKPNENLESNSIYNICVQAESDVPANSWAFQTKSELKVLSTLPENNTVVDILNTGIQIEFSKKVTNVDTFFDISPKVSGSFQYVGKSVTFVPTDSLTDGKKYTITIKNGLESIDGDKLKSDYVFSFTADEQIYSSQNIFLMNKNETFNSKNTHMTALVYGRNDYKNTEFHVNIYDLISYKKYLELRKVEDTIDTSKYSLAKTFSSNLVYGKETYSNTAFIVYPENLSTGWYLVDITTKDNNKQHLQQLIQVSDISVYMQSMNGEALIWCNDVETGLPLSNTTIKVGDKSVKTNENGVAIFKEENKKDVIITAKDGKQFAEYIDFYSDFKEDDYNIYMYTERYSYQPTDTINYWGMIVSQDSKFKLPKTAELYLNDELIESELSINSNGVFTGKFDISKHVAGYSELYLKFNNKTYFADYIIIEEYIKPTYILDFNFDKEYYRRNDIATIDVNASYFDGNPANNLQLNLTIENNTESITLDEAGKSQIKYAVNNTSRKSWYPGDVYASLQTVGEDEEAYNHNYFLYFPTDYGIKAEKNDNNELVIQTNKIDFTKLDYKTWNYDYEKIKGDVAPEVLGYIEVYRTDYIKTQIGTYYDFINKQNKPKYNYTMDKNLVETISFKTDNNGCAIIPFTYQNTPDSSYTMEINYIMPDGFEGIESVWNWGKTYNYYDYNEYYYFATDKGRLKTNEETIVKIINSQENEIIGKSLYVVQNEKIQEAAITYNKQFPIKYKEEYIPNVVLTGAYFDGANIYEIQDTYLIYNFDEKGLKINITADKESYEPGETVTLNIEAKDIYGKPAKTNMVISVVDEAAFAVNDQEEDPLLKLHQFNYYNPTKYFSYNDYNDFFAGGEGGGGDGPGVYREFFEDTAAFLTIKTGSNGKTSASFKLPDNITSWRITAIGITDALKAGVGKTNVISTLPFYTNVIMNPKYNINDDISFTLKTAGEYLPLLSSSIQYTASILKNDEVIISDKAYQLPLKSTTMNLGKLTQPGKYKLEIKSLCGAYKDVLVKEFEVVNSLHEINITKDIDLQMPIDIKAVKYPVSLMIYDIENERYYNIISKILKTSNGSTNDQLIAHNVVSKKLNELDENFNLSEIKIRNLQEYNGGAKLLEYSSDDVLLTAKICAVAPEYLDKFAACKYFEEVINNKESNSSEISAAYFGLAALKQPVLTDIKYLLRNNSGFTFEDNMNLIAGLAYIGDNLGANEWYVNTLNSRIKDEEGLKYLAFEEDYDTYSNTSFLSMILAKINHPDFDFVANYLLNKDSTEYTPALDLIAYINGYNPKIDSTGTIKYLEDEAENIVSFNDKKNITLYFNERDFKNFEIVEAVNVAGKITYIGTVDEVLDAYENNINITKEVSDESNIGDMRTVTLTINLPKAEENSYFVVDDIVPTGMRFVASEENYNRELQKVRFYIPNSKQNSKYIIKYQVRNILSGEFSVESAIITNSNSREIGFSEKSTITTN